MEEQKLFLDYGLEVEEDCPTACVSDQVGRQTAVQALDRVLVGDERFEDSETAYGRLGGVALD